MCRWGCNSTSTTYMCKWCGTWFCKQCLRGAYWGLMSEPLKCRVCFQKKCQGMKVDFVERPPINEEDSKGRKSAVGKPGKAASSKGLKTSNKSTAVSGKRGKTAGKTKKKKI